MLNKKFFLASFYYWFRLYFKYRFNLFFSFFSELGIPLLINILFMVGLTNSSAETEQIVNLVIYLVVANIVYTISVTDLESTISLDIKNSRLIYKLMEPISPCVSYISSDLAVKMLRILTFYLPSTLLLFLFGQIQYIRVICVIPFILIANVTGYCMSFIIGCLSFWITEIWGISAIKNLLLSVFAGTIFPFSFLSQKVQFFLFLTPFPYLGYVPSSFVLGEIGSESVVFLLCVGGIWCVIFATLAVLIWNCGKKKYESVGV